MTNEPTPEDDRRALMRETLDLLMKWRPTQAELHQLLDYVLDQIEPPEPFVLIP